MFKKILLIILLISILVACAETKSDIRNLILNNPAKQLNNYTYNFTSSLQHRIDHAPEVLLKYLKEMDKRDNYIPYELSEAEINLVIKYLSYLPEKYKQLLNNKLIGIYFIENFIGGGMADYVLDEDKSLYFVLIFNPLILKKSLQEWIEYRDNSSFEIGNIRITNNLGEKYIGFLQTLIHESSHIYDYYYRITPYTEIGIKYLVLSTFEKTQFTEKIWLKYSTPVTKYDFMNRDKISSYGLGELLPNSAIPTVYSDLSETPFCSLYGSQNWAEDFAELCTWYYLKRKFSLNYKVEIIDFNDTIFIYSPFENETLKNRFKLIDKILE